MNTSEIHYILERYCGDVFIGVFARDQLPTVSRRPALLVANTDRHTQPGEHWIAMYFGTDSEGEYFDSFGLDPHIDFVQYLNKNCVKWTRSDRQLQSTISSFCAHYCIFYCCFRSVNFDLQSILSWFSGDTMLNCAIVHRFACGKLKKLK
jgi:hypothetical protein